MPGPVSDSYDPVWGTAANAERVREAVHQVREKLAAKIQAPADFILDVVQRDNGPEELHGFTVRELRILRFACGCALEEEAI